MIMSEENIYDVIIVGAGLSGLTAAYHLLLHDRSLKILVLEAKGSLLETSVHIFFPRNLGDSPTKVGTAFDRVGGRTLTTTLQGGNGEDQWDLGGQWVGRPQIHVIKLIKELGLETYEQYSHGAKFARLSDGKIRKYTTSLPKVSPLSLMDIYLFLNKANKLCEEVTLNDPSMSAQAKTLDSLTLETFKQRHCWTEGAKELFDSACGVIFGAHPSQISMLFYLHYCKCAGGVEPILKTGKGSGQEWRIKGGAQSISLKLLEIIGEDHVWLQEPVDEINQENKEIVRVTTKTGKRISSKYIVMAVPPHQAMKINFTPSLPFNKEHLLHHMPVGHLIKFIITYTTPFWREDGLSGEVVSFDNFEWSNHKKSVHKSGNVQNSFTDEAPVSVMYDATTSNGNGALVGFISGLAATQWTHKTENEQRKGVIEFLKRFFGKHAENYLAFAIKDWSKEPWNGGCPVNYAAPGALSIYKHCLKEPFGKVHWAGTETATVWCGFMNGAVQAGRRSANEILKKLYPEFIFSCEDDHVRQITSKKSSKNHFWKIGILTSLILIVGVLLMVVH